MQPMAIIGVILIILGIIALGYQGITYFTHEKVVDLGPIQASVEKKHTVPLPPILGIAALIAGVALMVAGSKAAH